MIPGEILLSKENIIINEGKETVSLVVKNDGDRLIGVGSHEHFFEVNSHLKFDRNQTYGYRLDIQAGDMLFFEPGVYRTVVLVKIVSSDSAA